MPARNEIYEYIVFRGSDIDDLHVAAGPNDNKQGQVGEDPAIVQVLFDYVKFSLKSFYERRIKLWIPFWLLGLAYIKLILSKITCFETSINWDQYLESPYKPQLSGMYSMYYIIGRSYNDYLK